MMETELIVVPEGKTEQVLQPKITYIVPPDVWVLDAETKKVLNVSELSVAQAMRVILVPKIAGG